MGSKLHEKTEVPVLIQLASSSPRRKQILESVGLPFRVRVPQVEEIMPKESREAEAATKQNAFLKASAILNSLESADEIALGADTLVVFEDRVMGKPESQESSREMLELLSGKTHRVLTGIALLSPRRGQRQAVCESRVRFRRLTPDWIKQYSQTKEPYDKAGSYAMQGLGALMIEAIDGSHSNVMGLPIELLLNELSALVGRPVFDFFK